MVKEKAQTKERGKQSEKKSFNRIVVLSRHGLCTLQLLLEILNQSIKKKAAASRTSLLYTSPLAI